MADTGKKNSAIVIVNWNCWEDTARCVSACAKLHEFDGQLFVVDNGSTDDSYVSLQRFFKQQTDVDLSNVSEEICFLESRLGQFFTDIVVGDESSIAAHILSGKSQKRSLYLVRSEENRGFGAGNNKGIRLAMLLESVDLVWCLNADALPLPDALRALENNCLGQAQPLLAGSVLLDYSKEKRVQAIGSDFSRKTLKATCKHSGDSFAVLDAMPERYFVDYPIGAALVMNRAFIQQYGMFDERFFLYYEEPDLALMLQESRPFICTRSLVYHKGGQTTGGGQSVRNRSFFADYHYNRSRAILAMKIGASGVFMAFLASLFSVVRRIQVGRFDLAKGVLPAFWNGVRGS